MATWLKQSTAVDVKIGPFLDDTDGKTAETALTITQPDILLGKNGGAFAQKNAAQTLAHESNGWYEVALDTTDTNTLGILIVQIHEAGALPCWREFMVVPAETYDSFISGTGNGPFVNVAAISGDSVAADNLESEYDGTGYGHILQRTTIATLSSQTSFTLTAGSADNDAYNGCIAVIEDATTAAQKAVGVVLDYVGASKTITLLADPAVFTMAATDKITLIADKALKATVPDRTLDVSAGGEAGVDWANVGSPTTTVGLSGTTVKTATDVEADTTDIQGRLPAALVSGRIDASVGAMAANVLTATAINADAITAAKIADGAIDAATLATGTITAAKFAAGAIDAAAIATGAIDADAIAADAITAAKVAADVSAEIADAVWDEAASGHVAAGSFGEQCGTDIDAILVDTGTTLQAEVDGIQADTEDIQARLPAALVDGKMNAYTTQIDNNIIQKATFASDALAALGRGILVDKAAEAGTTSTNIETSLPAATVVDALVGMMVYFTSGENKGAGRIITANDAGDAFNPSTITVSPAFAATPAEADTLEIIPASSTAAGSSPTTAEIVDGVWDEPQAGHVTADTFGDYLDAKVSEAGGGAAPTVEQIADAVWDEAIAGHLAAGSTGEALDNAGAAGTPPTVEEIRTEMDANSTKLASIEGDTQDLQTRVPAALVSGRIDASVGAMAANVVTAAAIADNAIDAGAIAADAITAAKIATGAVDADALAADAVTEIQAGLATAVNVDDAETAILAAVAALSIPTANETADAWLDRASAVDGRTPRQILRLMGAFGGGKSSGGTSTDVIRSISDAKDRITTAIDANGHRTSVTLDLD